MTKQITLLAACKVECPSCGAKKGELCTSTTGNIMRAVVHVSRLLVVKEKK